MEIRFASIEGVRTRYLIAGSGPPVLLVHGIGLSLECWLRNIDPLSKKHTVVAADLLGHGFADAVDFGRDASQSVNARHLGRLARSLGLDRYSVAGSSYGGLVAALMYFQEPQRVQKLALIGTASSFQTEQDQAKALRAAAANAKQALERPTLESCRRRLEAIVHDPAAVHEALLWLQLTMYAAPDRLPAYEQTIQSCIDHLGDTESRVRWRLEKIGVPVWVISGREDIRADWRQHESGAARIPDARLSIYEKCGHLPFLEHADRFNADLLAFLGNSK
jgi:pimeloyl-ACP methyl ester carboxylesterase